MSQLKVLPHLLRPINSALDNWALRRKPPSTEKRLLLIRQEAIGDYILFRPFFPALRKAFPDWKITLLGNSLWRSLAETLDTAYFDEFIWGNPKKFRRNPKYRYDFYRNIFTKNYHTAISPSFSRQINLESSLAYASGAKKRWAAESDTVNLTRNELQREDATFTKILPSLPVSTFEFLRLKHFFSQIIPEATLPEKVTLPQSLSTPKGLPTRYAVFFPGAGIPWRQWPVAHFAKVADFLQRQGYQSIVFAGGPADYGIAEEIKAKTSHSDCQNWCGKTSLPEFLGLLQQADFLVSNESSAVHIMAALGKPFFCVSNGNHLGRFHPYPEHWETPQHYFYPEEIKNLAWEEALKRYAGGSSLPISSVSPDLLIAELGEFLHDNTKSSSKIG